MAVTAKRRMEGGHSGLRFAIGALEAESRSNTGCARIPSEGEDLREHPRDPAHDLSEIILDGRTYGIACLIRDISRSGARLEVSCGELPKRFILANYTKGTRTLCRQVWRDKRLVGVKFLTTPRAFNIAERL